MRKAKRINYGRFAEFPEKRHHTMYWQTCVLSVQGKSDEAMAILARALESGVWWHPHLLAQILISNRCKNQKPLRRLLNCAKKNWKSTRAASRRGFSNTATRTRRRRFFPCIGGIRMSRNLRLIGLMSDRPLPFWFSAIVAKLRL